MHSVYTLNLIPWFNCWFPLPCLLQLTKSEDAAGMKLVMEVSQMIVDCLVENVLTLDENDGVYIVLFSPTNYTHVESRIRKKL